MNKMLVLDGHDGSGKTTLCKRLADELGGKYVRPYGPPFGDKLLKAAEDKDFESVIRTARLALQQVLDELSVHSQVLVFDRLWITIFTLLPNDFHSQWTFRAHTTVCWADLHTTLARIDKRKETKYSEDWHTYYISLYRELAEHYRCPLLDTGKRDEEASLKELLRWAHSVLEQNDYGE